MMRQLQCHKGSRGRLDEKSQFERRLAKTREAYVQYWAQLENQQCFFVLYFVITFLFVYL